MSGGTIKERLLEALKWYREFASDTLDLAKLVEALQAEYRKTNECQHGNGAYFHQDNSRDGWNTWECCICGARTVDKKKWL